MTHGQLLDEVARVIDPFGETPTVAHLKAWNVLLIAANAVRAAIEAEGGISELAMEHRRVRAALAILEGGE